HPPQEVLAQRLGHQDARLELQHARVEGREDRPHTVLVKMTHDRLGAFGMVELQAHHHPVLADADEEVRIEIAYLVEAGANEVGDVADRRDDLRALADLQHFHRDDAADLRATRGGHVGKPVFLEPATVAFGDDAAGNGIKPAGDALAGHQDVGFDAVPRDAPHGAGPHEPGLDLVGDVERTIPFTELLDARQVTLLRHREAVGRRYRLHDHGGDVAA